jgi:hypothetical protein
MKMLYAAIFWFTLSLVPANAASPRCSIVSLNGLDLELEALPPAAYTEGERIHDLVHSVDAEAEVEHWLPSESESGDKVALEIAQIILTKYVYLRNSPKLIHLSLNEDEDRYHLSVSVTLGIENEFTELAVTRLAHDLSQDPEIAPMLFTAFRRRGSDRLRTRAIKILVPFLSESPIMPARVQRLVSGVVN